MQSTEKTSIQLQVETPGGSTDSCRLSDLDRDFLMSFKRKGSSKSIKDVFLSRDNSGNQLETLDDAPSSERSSKSKPRNGDIPKGETNQRSFDEGFRTNSNNHLQCPTETSGSPSPSRLSQLQSGLDPAGSSSSSSTFSSRTSSSSLDGISRFRLLNRQLSCRIKKSWSFRKMEQLTKKVRSHSDVGVYEGIIGEESFVLIYSLPSCYNYVPELGSSIPPPSFSRILSILSEPQTNNQLFGKQRKSRETTIRLSRFKITIELSLLVTFDIEAQNDFPFVYIHYVYIECFKKLHARYF